MEYPNKTFVLETINEPNLSGVTIKRKHIIIVVADSKETACEYLKCNLGFNGVPNDLVWLMDCNYPTMYDQTGNKELNVQAKIMYNTVVLMKD